MKHASQIAGPLLASILWASPDRIVFDTPLCHRCRRVPLEGGPHSLERVQARERLPGAVSGGAVGVFRNDSR